VGGKTTSQERERPIRQFRTGGILSNERKGKKKRNVLKGEEVVAPGLPSERKEREKHRANRGVTGAPKKKGHEEEAENGRRYEGFGDGSPLR